ncbi:hypothetical protein DUI87_07847 [Hirundo rustica rustica]|uniref:Uncharacterized protein n=1 Tax=Hirundo rustica rustica TaxID=333673 RepID=A0A3M0KR52_HIRRU|nr:hypothetical protein DUI87_07847 [Hirundo rustica rustica]
MLSKLFREEILPAIQVEPLLVQFEAMSFHPVPCCLGEVPQPSFRNASVSQDKLNIFILSIRCTDDYLGVPCESRFWIVHDNFYCSIKMQMYTKDQSRGDLEQIRHDYMVLEGVIKDTGSSGVVVFLILQKKGKVLERGGQFHGPRLSCTSGVNSKLPLINMGSFID